jgi:hypothetical protein
MRPFHPPPFRPHLRLVILLAPLCVMLAPAYAEQRRPPRSPPALRELVVVNRSQLPVSQLYVSPASADGWGDDRLGDGRIEPGGSFRVRLGRTRECEFDVQVIYENARREENRGVDVCHARQVSFDGSLALAPPEAFGAEHEVTLTNRTGRAIQLVFISGSSSDQWGDERLNGGAIATGEARTIAYRGGCTGDLRVVFDNRAAEERRLIDLCAYPAITIHPGWTTEDTPGDPAPDMPDAVVVANRSGSPITEFYLFPPDAPDDAEDRAHDLLGNAVLPDGARTTLSFRRGTACHFMARAAHGGDRPPQDLPGIDLCAGAEVRVPAP